MEHEIRQKLDAYLRDEVSLNDFRRWLIEQTWDNKDAPEVAHAIAYVIDDAATSGTKKPELDERLRELAQIRARDLAAT